MAVFLSRLLRQARRLERFRFAGKLNGASGNYSALLASFPDYDWEGFAGRFVSGLGLEPNRATTQVEDGDRLSEYFSIVLAIDMIVLDLDLDIWEYISRGEIVQLADPDEVGSSTMPHKVNPIRFETSEGNISVANALLQAFMTTLTRSRMQRDLSGSTIRRNIGVALPRDRGDDRWPEEGRGRLRGRLPRPRGPSRSPDRGLSDDPPRRRV